MQSTKSTYYVAKFLWQFCSCKVCGLRKKNVWQKKSRTERLCETTKSVGKQLGMQLVEIGFSSSFSLTNLNMFKVSINEFLLRIHVCTLGWALWNRNSLNSKLLWFDSVKPNVHVPWSIS